MYQDQTGRRVIYVDPGIWSYCQTAQVPLDNFCKSIEPALVDYGCDYVKFDPQNQYHVYEVVQLGRALISTNQEALFAQIPQQAPPPQPMMMPQMQMPQFPQFQPQQSAQEAFDKAHARQIFQKNTLDLSKLGIPTESQERVQSKQILKSLGIDFDQNAIKCRDDEGDRRAAHADEPWEVRKWRIANLFQ